MTNSNSRLPGVGRIATVAVIVSVLIIGGLGYLLVANVVPTASSTSMTTSTSAKTSAPATLSSTTSSSAASTLPIRISIASSIATSENNFWPMLAGIQQGIFLKHGLDVTWNPYKGGGPMYQAAAAGSAPIGTTGIIANIQARATNVTVKCVADYLSASTFKVLVDGSGPIQNVKQLDGKTVGVSALGGLEQFYFIVLAKNFNLSLSYVGTGGLPNSVALLKTGRISAFVFTVNSVLSLVDSGQLRAIYSVRDSEPSNWQDGNCVYVTDQFIRDNPQVVRAFVAGFLESIQFLIDHPDVAAKIYVEQTNSTQSVALAAFKNMPWNPSGSIDPSGFGSMEQTLAGAGLIKGQLPPVGSLYDSSFLPKS